MVKQMQRKRILFFTSSSVEMDNFLPIFSIFKTANDCEVVVLDYCRNEVSTKFFDYVVGSSPVFPVYYLMPKGPLRSASLALSYLLEFLSVYSTRLFFVKLSRTIRVALRWLIKALPSGICNKTISSYDILFISPSLSEQVIHGKSPVYRFMIDWESLVHSRIVFFPETFDQFTDVPEFQHIKEVPNFDKCKAMLCRDLSTVSNALPGSRYICIGAPRYSKYWTDFISDFYKFSIDRSAEKAITVLYLPIKASPPVGWLFDEIKSHDQSVFSLLDRFQNLRIIVKPHPRTIGAYDDLPKRLHHYGRVEIFNNMVDTAELVERSDLCITGGTSFIPHLLWRNIPVVLIDDWASKLGHEFLLKSYCHSLSSIDELINDVRLSRPTRSFNDEQSLAKLFQCGMASSEYLEFLKSKIEIIA